MRVSMAVALTLLLMIGTYYYTSFADRIRREPVQFNVAMDDQTDWRVEIVRTFDCVIDPDFAPTSLVVQLKGLDILRRNENIPSVQPVVIKHLENVEIGSNELYIEANLATYDQFDFSSAQPAKAMRVRVFRDDMVVADKSFWIDGGTTTIQETIRFEAPPSIANAPGNSNHDHQP